MLYCFRCFFSQPKPVAAAGNTYYVATTGSDSNPGTLAQPWLTIQHAAEIATAGDTINIESGTYTESITPWNSGTASSYITYQNYNGEVVNIDGGSSYANINTGTRSYLQFIGLNCIGATTVGMLVPTGGYNIIIQNCSFSNCIEQGLSISGAYVTVNGCTVTGVNSAGINECISLEGATYFTIENCIVHDPVASGRAGIDAKDGCSNGSINNNTVYNCSGGGIYLDGGGSPQYNINVYDNLVYNNAPFPGLVINCENSPANQTNLNFYNNIVYGNGTGFASWNCKFSETFSLINNTFYNNDGVAIEVFEPSPYNVNCFIRNNIIFESTSGAASILTATANDTGVIVDHNLFYNAGGSWRSGNVLGTAYVTGNPLLTNPTTNFNISSNSPAIGAGSSTLAPSTDYVGTSRPQGAGYDIGAYQYSTSGSSTTHGTNNTNSKSTMLVTSSANPSSSGQAITFTVSVNAVSPETGTPTGDVAIRDGTTLLGTWTLNSAGEVTYSTSNLAIGTHTINVTYMGDSNFASSAASLTQTVNGTSSGTNAASSNTSVTSSISPSASGQVVTFTVTVSAVSPATGIPTGYVAIRDGTTLLGTWTLNSAGNVTYSTSALAVGTHTINVTYMGDSNFAASAGSLTQTVNGASSGTNAASSNTSVTSSISPSASGQVVTFTVTVSAVPRLQAFRQAM